MQIKLTSRDKLLLTLLAFLVIGVVFIYYLIMPTLTRMDDLDLEIADAQVKQQEMKLKLIRYPEYQQSFLDMQQTAADETAQYYDMMTSQEVDREITNIVLSCGLESVGLNISPAVYTEAEPYVYSMLALQDSMESAAQAVPESTGEQSAQDIMKNGVNLEETPPAPTRVDDVQEQIYTCAIRLVVEGTEENYQYLIDTLVNGYPAIRVTSISYQRGQTRTRLLNDGTTVQEDGIRQLTLGLDMYMCDKRLYQQVSAGENTADVAELLNRAMDLLNELNGGSEAETGEQADGR